MISKILYKTSRDYERLFELISQGFEVICFVNYSEYGGRDICICRIHDGRYALSARGIGYERRFRFTKDNLIQDWKEQNLEFIEPDENLMKEKETI